MPLTPAGRETRTEKGVNALATDTAGNTVIVVTTDEAAQDCGWPTIWAIASDKYDAGDVDRSGPVPRVSVTTMDCRD